MNEPNERPTLTPREAAQEHAGQNGPPVIDTHGEELPTDHEELARYDSHCLGRIAEALEHIAAALERGRVMVINGEEFEAVPAMVFGHVAKKKTGLVQPHPMPGMGRRHR